jgi:hypothetical protein
MTIYTQLFTGQYQNAIKTLAAFGVSELPLVKCQALNNSFSTIFDLDTATGQQLDICGEWIGQSRQINIELVGVYFEWDAHPESGWDLGIWKETDSPDSGTTILPDDVYRQLLIIQAFANQWGGTNQELINLYARLDGVTLVDNHDMTMLLLIEDSVPPITRNILTAVTSRLRPSGVELITLIIPAGAKVFFWDFPSDGTAGWDAGYWP